MKQDLSRVLYTKYYSLRERTIWLKTKDFSAIGRFEGYFKGDEFGSSYIIKWRFVSAQGVTFFIEQSTILFIRFLEDQTEMKF